MKITRVLPNGETQEKDCSTVMVEMPNGALVPASVISQPNPLMIEVEMEGKTTWVSILDIVSW
jgi:hypothetical protein